MQKLLLSSLCPTAFSTITPLFFHPSRQYHLYCRQKYSGHVRTGLMFCYCKSTQRIGEQAGTFVTVSKSQDVLQCHTWVS